MPAKYFIVIFLFFPFIIISCIEEKYRARVSEYHNANTIGEKGKWMAAGYRSYFFSKEGEGENKNAVLADFDNWDGNLNPDIRIIDKKFIKKERKWVMTILEQNDFSKLISYPGWKAIEEISFDNDGKIIEMIYKPDSTNPSYKKWLQPALEWLTQNKPGELPQIYSNNKLVKTKATALLWVKVLTEWKQSRKLSSPNK